MNIKSLEHLLSPAEPLAGRWEQYACDACAHRFLLDLRVYRMPGVEMLQRSGALSLSCPQCGSQYLSGLGMVVS